MSKLNEWTKRALGELLDADFSGAWGDNPKHGGGNSIVLRSTNIDNEGHVDLAGGVARQLSSLEISRKRLKTGDILLEASGGGPGTPVGRVARFVDDHKHVYACSNFFRTLRPNSSNVHSKYLAWRLQWAYRLPNIWNYQQQTTGIINLKHADYLAQPIDLPPRVEQAKIAEILDTVDESIRSTERLIAKLKVARQGLASSLLGIAHVNLPLGDILNAPQSFVQTGPFGSQLHAAEYVNDGTPVILPQDIVDGRISLSSIARITPLKAAALSRHRVQAGDVIFARRGDLSKAAAISPSEEGWICGTGCLLLRPSDRINSYWLVEAYRQDSCQRQVAALAVGSTMVNLNTSILHKLTIPLPGRSDQDRVVNLLHANDRHVQLAERDLQKNRKVKQGLMEDLLTGRVRAAAG